MTDLPERLARLTPERRALLAATLASRSPAPLATQPGTPSIEEPQTESSRPLAFSVFFFSDQGAQRTEDPYRLVMSAAKFADTHGFEAVWLPERHFHEFGGLYPNPSVLAAAIAVVTERVRIRAGSVVVPLHHPARIAEEWAVVDNLSGGRVDISAASGWVREDFVLSGADFESRRDETFTRLQTVRALWRGEKADVRPPGSDAPVVLRTWPRPVQPELTVWVTTAGNPQTWERAGTEGFHVLTGLLQSTVPQVAENVAAYRKARADAGHDPDTGRVTLMMHTFVGSSQEEVLRVVHDPLVAYLETHLNLYESLPSVREALPVRAEDFTEDDKAALAKFAFERYVSENGLFGTPASCLAMTRQLQMAGIDEVACLIDFGVDDDTVMAGLEGLDALRRSVVENVERAAAGTPAGVLP